MSNNEEALFLRPSFLAPKPSIFRSQSQFGRLETLAGMTSTPAANLLEFQKFQSKQQLQHKNENKNLNSMKKLKTSDSLIDIFDGKVLFDSKKSKEIFCSDSNPQAKKTNDPQIAPIFLHQKDSQQIPLSSFKKKSNDPDLAPIALPIAPMFLPQNKDSKKKIHSTVSILPNNLPGTSGTEISGENGPKIRDKQLPMKSITGAQPAKDQKEHHTLDSGLLNQDFHGIQTFCRNVGGSIEGLNIFKEKIKTAKCVALGIIWGNSLTNNHVTTTVKYCTPSSNCSTWHCACDRHIRVEQSFKRLLGAVILFESELEYAYFIPLSKCFGNGDDATSWEPHQSKHQSSPRIPLSCNTSLLARWVVFLSLLSHQYCEKIIFNSQLAFLPILETTDSLYDSVPSLFQNQPSLSESILFDQCGIQSNQIVFQSLFDVRIAAWLCDSDIAETDLELSVLSANYGLQQPSVHSLDPAIGKAAFAVQLLHRELLNLFELRRILLGRMEANRLIPIFRNLEMPICTQLNRMELTGICVSVERLKILHSNISNAIRSIETEAHQIAGIQFNLASPEQVANILYNSLNLPHPATSSSKGRHLSTSEEDLLKIQSSNPIVKLILSFRTLSKTLSTYIEGYKPLIYTQIRSEPSCSSSSPLLSKIHASWNQTTVRTGRLSCSKPNLQNIPNKQEVQGMDLNMRSVFVASPGCIFISADYSQIEMRILAHISRDSAMCRLFADQENGGDIYRLLASTILKKPLELVTDNEREKAKVICLGQIYGMGTPAAAAKLDIDLQSAGAIVKSFFDTYPQVKTWIQQTKASALSVGYVCTLLGRRRFLSDISSSDRTRKSYAERQAVNSVIQGSASDLIKFAMLGIEKEINKSYNIVSGPTQNSTSLLPSYLRPRLLMQIHDELFFEVPIQRVVSAERSKTGSSFGSSKNEHIMSEEFEEFVHLTDIEQDENVLHFSSLLIESMTTHLVSALKLTVPLKTKIQIGSCWGNMREFNSLQETTNIQPNDAQTETGLIIQSTHPAHPLNRSILGDILSPLGPSELSLLQSSSSVPPPSSSFFEHILDEDESFKPVLSSTNHFNSSDFSHHTKITSQFFRNPLPTSFLPTGLIEREIPVNNSIHDFTQEPQVNLHNSSFQPNSNPRNLKRTID